MSTRGNLKNILFRFGNGKQKVCWDRKTIAPSVSNGLPFTTLKKHSESTSVNTIVTLSNCTLEETSTPENGHYFKGSYIPGVPSLYQAFSLISGCHCTHALPCLPHTDKFDISAPCQMSPCWHCSESLGVVAACLVDVSFGAPWRKTFEAKDLMLRPNGNLTSWMAVILWIACD